jgi:glutamate dehydrogenase/leucine dehydrogenase
MRQHARRILEIVDQVEARCMAADDDVTPTLKEITESEMRRLWLAAKAIAEGAEQPKDPEATAALKRTLAKAREGL